MPSSSSAPRATVALFTRDLRVHDNPVLAAAAASGNGRVVPLFVLDGGILPRISPPRRRFLEECLADLDTSLRKLGGHLVLRSGDVVAEVCRVAAEVDAVEVHVASDVTAYAQGRQDALASALRAMGAELHLHDHTPSSRPAICGPPIATTSRSSLRTGGAGPRCRCVLRLPRRA